jgi:hypothetical protein
MNEVPYKDRKGRIYRYGEFFPPEFSNIPYNHSVAHEYFPINKDIVLENGVAWIESEKRTYQPTIRAEDLPDTIENVPDSTIKEVIACPHNQECAHECTGAFRILPEELSFYRKVGIPLPRLCSNCRYAERIKQRAPLKLWHRQCMCNQPRTNNLQPKTAYKNTTPHAHGDAPCPNEFETSYAPEREEIIYCEECYQKEVV